MFVGPGESPTSVALPTATAVGTPLPLADLIRTGTIRAAFNRVNISCVGETNGRASGLCVDIARDIAVDLRVTLHDQTFASGTEMCEAGRRGQWDIAFVGGLDDDICRPDLVYTAPYLELEQTYLVASNSPFRSVADVDAPGIRIASFRQSPIYAWLRRNVQHATLIEASSIAEGTRLIEQGHADAYAASRAELVERASRFGGIRVLADSVTRVPWRIAVATGRTDLLAYVTSFLTTAKTNGAILRAIAKNQLAGAVIAP